MNCLKVKKPSTSTTQIKVIFTNNDKQRSIVGQEAAIEGTKKRAKSNSKGEIIFKMSKIGINNIQVPMPDGSMKLLEGIEVKRGKTKVVEVEI